MKMRKLLAALVVVSIMMTGVAFAAVETTTTVSYTVGGTAEVTTTIVGGVADGSMVTYVLYGDDSTSPFDTTTGEVEADTTATPKQDNIFYIDQINEYSSTTNTFTAKGLSVNQAYSSNIIVGTNDADSGAGTSTVVDTYTLTLTANDSIEAVEVTYTMDEVSYTYVMDVANASVHVPAAVGCTLEFIPTAGNKITSATINGTNASLTANKAEIAAKAYEADATVAVVAETTADDRAKTITIDGNEYIAASDAENESVTFYITSTGFSEADLLATTIKISNGTDTLEVKPIQTYGGRYALKLIEGTDTDFVTVDGTYTITPVNAGYEFSQTSSTNTWAATAVN